MGNYLTNENEKPSAEADQKIQKFLYPDNLSLNELAQYADQICVGMIEAGKNPPMGEISDYNQTIYEFNMTSWGNLAYVVLNTVDEVYRKETEEILNKGFKALKEERDNNRIKVIDQYGFLSYVKV